MSGRGGEPSAVGPALATAAFIGCFSVGLHLVAAPRGRHSGHWACGLPVVSAPAGEPRRVQCGPVPAPAFPSAVRAAGHQVAHVPGTLVLEVSPASSSCFHSRDQFRETTPRVCSMPHIIFSVLYQLANAIPQTNLSDRHDNYTQVPSHD